MVTKRLCSFHWGWTTQLEGGRFRKNNFWICERCESTRGKGKSKDKAARKWTEKSVGYMSSIT